MTKKDQYLCPRCGFTTNNRYNMKKHLYDLKKICPGTKNVITLTDEIKEHILENRIYKIVKETNNTVININNNYQQINNIISNMNQLDKLNKYMQYKNIELVDIDETISDSFSTQVKKLKHNKYKDYQLNLENIINLIDDITTINDIEKLNILYDDILNKLKIFCDGEWKSYLIEYGIKELIEKIKEYYLDAYECYIIRKIHDKSNNLRYINELKEALKEYYKFLAWFNIQPYIYERNNNKILYNLDNSKFLEFCDDFSICDEFYNIYLKIASKINKSEQNKIKKGLESIIKNNTKAFFIDLNKKFTDTVHNDEEFKKCIINC